MHKISFAIVSLALAFTIDAQQSWRFAVAGDSRNCGDVVMPAIAPSISSTDAQFYWHLGDFRRIYDFDEDMQAVKPRNISDYEAAAWPDFISQQLGPFAPLTAKGFHVYLGIGNHEVIPPMTQPAWLLQFADWLTQPEIVSQRLKDDPSDHQLHAYYHWIVRGVDFINVDNSSYAFDDPQEKWIEARISADMTDPAITTIVIGGHAALPHSQSCDHSMNQTSAGEHSGVLVYRKLLDAQKAGKKVYLLASHSHFIADEHLRHRVLAQQRRRPPRLDRRHRRRGAVSPSGRRDRQDGHLRLFPRDRVARRQHQVRLPGDRPQRRPRRDREPLHGEARRLVLR